jgi:integrase
MVDLLIGYPTLKIHELRHTFATLLVASGVDIVTAKNLMGHSDSRMLTKIYAHLVDQNAVSAMDKMGDELFKEKKGKIIKFA